MSKYDAIRAMIDRVDNLPLDTSFNYYDCDTCLFGWGIYLTTGMHQCEFWADSYKNLPDGYDPGRFIDIARGHLFGLTGDEFYEMYNKLDPRICDASNKHLVCEMAREMVAGWESNDAIRNAKDVVSATFYRIDEAINHILDDHAPLPLPQGTRCDDVSVVAVPS